MSAFSAINSFGELPRREQLIIAGVTVAGMVFVLGGRHPWDAVAVAGFGIAAGAIAVQEHREKTGKVRARSLAPGG